MNLRFPIRIFKVADNSMEPALKPGSYVLVNQWYTWLAPGDIIVLKHPSTGMLVIKRISRIDNDRIAVLGDNQAASEDSRVYGTIGRDAVIGKVLKIFDDERQTEKMEERI